MGRLPSNCSVRVVRPVDAGWEDGTPLTKIPTLTQIETLPQIGGWFRSMPSELSEPGSVPVVERRARLYVSASVSVVESDLVEVKLGRLPWSRWEVLRSETKTDRAGPHHQVVDIRQTVERR